MLQEDILWRSQEDRFSIRKESVQEILKCDIGSFYNYFPTWMQGFDK